MSVDFCIGKYGYSKFQSEEPYVEVIKDNTTYFGWYDCIENVIYLNKTCMFNTTEYCKTIIHEYQHYLQSPTWNTRYDRKFIYSKHPYEKQAEFIAVKDYKKLMRYLRK